MFVGSSIVDEGVLKCTKRDEIISIDNFESILQPLICGFMSSRFPRTSAMKLASILFDQYLPTHLKPFIQHQTIPGMIDISKLNCRLRILSEMFERKTIIGLYEPLCNSNLMPKGFYLSQHITIEPKSTNVNYSKGDCLQRFIIWKEENQKEVPEQEQETVVKSTDNCAQNALGFLQWKYKQTKQLFQKLTQELKVNLLVMNRGLPDYARGLCEEFGLAVIEYAPLDEVNDLASGANILGKAIYP